MLELKDIVKNYYVADKTVEALKGINLNFRDKEFVSILGPSGCGKTTLLNIIGGLDQYTTGDLIINGRSTKSFSDRDWDVYRNHRIGFIFQTYNLIPHQTVLENVELALTIAGVSKQERVERAKRALDKVGLKGEYNKKPNQLSGGQQQRVAIARALVNEPEILLADEPTGALDTQTSIQIMELIKEIASERLVIMVTHNPDLANAYSTRIIRILDGEIKEDSNPYFGKSEEETQVASVADTEKKSSKKVKNKTEKAKMSFWTAFKLSAKNLISKLKRTIMVIIAGSIGIIGVLSVLSVSTGVKDYITSFQDDMLAGNPIAIEATGMDYNAMMDSSSFAMKYDAIEYGDWVNVNSMLEYFITNQNAWSELMYTNDINADYANYIKSMPREYYKEILFDYGLELMPSIYTDFSAFTDETKYSEYSEYSRVMSINAITETYTALLEKTEYKDYSSYVTQIVRGFTEGIANNDYILEQYDVLAGELPKKSTDIIVVLNDDEQLTDLFLTQLGYYTQEQFYNMIYKYNDEIKDSYVESLNKNKFSYDEILGKKFTWYPNDTIYKAKSVGKLYQEYEYFYEADESWDTGLELDICAIVKPKANRSYGALETGFIYTEDFAREVVKRNINSEIVKNINKYGNVASLKYGEMPMGIHYDLKYLYSLDGSLTFVEADGEEGHDPMKQIFVGKSNSGMRQMFMSYMSDFSSGSSGSGDIMSSLANMKEMDLNSVGGSYVPVGIYIYPKSFDDKYLVTDYLNLWNNDEKSVTFNDYKADLSDYGSTSVKKKTLNVSGREHIKYTDSVEVVVRMMNNVIDVITYALVVFTALSLVVSTVMVGIITYVSVVERVKEIGIIRSLGGRKKDVSHLFNAETFIIGLASGIFGVLVTWLLTLLANVIVGAVSGGMIAVIAHLTWSNALIMILVSVVLTLISGLIPSRAAARKNPVEALRTE